MKGTARRHSIGVIPGDGIGPEVVAAALNVLDAIEPRFGFTTDRTSYPWSGAEHLATGRRVTPADFEPLRDHGAVLLGALGHPQVRPGVLERDIVIALRRTLDLYVNLRPLELFADRLSPLRDAHAADIDILIVRENTEDVYGVEGTRGGEGTADEWASAEMRFTRRGIARIVRYAFERAQERPRRRITLVDKANAIPIQNLWREIFAEVGEEFPDVERGAAYADAAAMFLVLDPRRYDVIVTTNLFGDILSDVGAGVCGGLGMAPSANLHPGRTSVFEPVHGSAPEYAGQGVASPIGAIGALAMLLAHLGEDAAGAAVRRAIRETIADGRIPDVALRAGSTASSTATIIAALETAPAR
ncbi:MAG TPA: isocitrate/isopropylmalate family dehydrogenase [Candidatus Limnocylindria bacterium]|jgi:3-isopropylmalate dehydrogenase